MGQNRSGRRMPTPATNAAPATPGVTGASKTSAGSDVDAPASLAAEAGQASIADQGATSTQQASTDTSQATPAVDAPADPDELVPVRILVDRGDHRCNDVVELPAREVEAAELAGWADSSPNAIAAAIA
jgi:hypothetical protein